MRHPLHSTSLRASLCTDFQMQYSVTREPTHINLHWLRSHAQASLLVCWITWGRGQQIFHACWRSLLAWCAQACQEISDDAASHTCNIINTASHTCSIINTASHTCSIINTASHTCSIINTASHACSITNTASHTCSITNTASHTCSITNTASHTCRRRAHTE